ncbi:hypothetical protein N7516_002405 [Penicillium verrucosum]|uniref:uncharacterized protein n=1 Tax=Penicillium verrucosum TaxID=60171 RepID=UPI0025458E46|nr:uncharacterized protein N7516_002405 [Penicillium verrucosum]KAJ5942237.1 hypothetical protein N7516_002405 [Penicillium verrucosum]
MKSKISRPKDRQLVSMASRVLSRADETDPITPHHAVKPRRSGFLGPRTEKFALGSLSYLINYGFEVYGDRCLTENPNEHGRKLDNDPLIGYIIYKYVGTTIMPRLRNWPHTQRRFSLEETIGGRPMPTISVPEWRQTTARVIRGWALVLDRTSEATNPEIANDGEPDGYSRDTSQNHSRISLRKKCSVRAWRSVGFFIMQHQGGQLARGYSKKSSGVPAKPAFIIIHFYVSLRCKTWDGHKFS